LSIVHAPLVACHVCFGVNVPLAYCQNFVVTFCCGTHQFTGCCVPCTDPQFANHTLNSEHHVSTSMSTDHTLRDQVIMLYQLHCSFHQDAQILFVPNCLSTANFFVFRTRSRLETNGACDVTWVGVKRVWNSRIRSHSYRSFANTLDRTLSLATVRASRCAAV
jgi:hypothetical protein